MNTGQPQDEDASIDGLGLSKAESLIVAVPSMDAQSKDHASKDSIIFCSSLTWRLGCVTAYKKTRLATFAHGGHATLKVDDVIDIFSVSDTTTPNSVRVFCTNPVFDLVLLKSVDDNPLFDSHEFFIGLPDAG